MLSPQYTKNVLNLGTCLYKLTYIHSQLMDLRGFLKDTVHSYKKIKIKIKGKKKRIRKKFAQNKYD